MNSNGALLFDGASRRQALIWLASEYPQHSLFPLLQGTAYAALADIGPILLDADPDSPLPTAWSQGQPGLQHSVWLRTCLQPDDLASSLRRRLRVRSPDGREFWLRLADARPLLNAWQTGQRWPTGFWHGVIEVWLGSANGPLQAWQNDTPEQDGTTPASTLNAQVRLDWPLLSALAQPDAIPEPSHP